VLDVHTVVSFDFAGALFPAGKRKIFRLYLWPGDYSGLAMGLTFWRIPLRKATG